MSLLSSVTVFPYTVPRPESVGLNQRVLIMLLTPDGISDWDRLEGEALETPETMASGERRSCWAPENTWWNRDWLRMTTIVLLFRRLENSDRWRWKVKEKNCWLLVLASRNYVDIIVIGIRTNIPFFDLPVTDKATIWCEAGEWKEVQPWLVMNDVPHCHRE